MKKNPDKKLNSGMPSPIEENEDSVLVEEDIAGAIDQSVLLTDEGESSEETPRSFTKTSTRTTSIIDSTIMAFGQKSAGKGGTKTQIDRFYPDVESGLSNEQVGIRMAQGLNNVSKMKKGNTYKNIFFTNIFTFFNMLILAVFIAMIVFMEDIQEVSKLFFMAIALANVSIGIIQEIKSLEFLLTSFIPRLFIKWSVCSACSVVLALFVHTECIPACRTIDVLFRNVVHANRDSHHGAHCDQVSTDVAIGDCTVVSTPVHHYLISCLECGTFFAIAARSEPCTRPCRVCTLHEFIGNFLRKIYCPTFSDLENRADTLNEVKTDHSSRHLALCCKVAGESAATEVIEASLAPYSSVCHLLDIFVSYFPPFLHNVVAVFICANAGSVETCSTGVEKVDKTVGLSSFAF